MVGAKIHIENPDNNIYLGIEAKLKILTASESDVLLVPVESVNIDNEGEFCFAIENGMLVRKPIQSGISSDIYVQVKDGLSEGDEIVTSSYMGMDISEGMAVTPMPSN